ncbi:MAG TPA: glycosyltransferase family 39 protein [Gaiellaceae bacterium]|nr:glycosyltransferase family 39 protein [Gaiellaceae bacterium]
MSRVWELARRVAPPAVVVAAATILVSAQPVTSPWWIYADADGTYSASALNIISGGHSRYFDHPGLPEQEVLALTFGAVSLAHGGPTRAWADNEMIHLDRARPVFRGWAIFFFIGGAALAYFLLRRLLGHWTWGVAGGLLWLAMPDLTDTLQIRPDVLLSGLMLLTGFLIVRAYERRSTALYAVAAGVAGVALMTKLHSVAILPALILAATLAHPAPGWWRELRRDARQFAVRHRIGLSVSVITWFALFVIFNRDHFVPSVHNLHLSLLVLLVLAVLAYAAATWAVTEHASNRALRRVFDPFFLVLAGAFAVGIAIPLSLVLNDSPRVLIDTFETLIGRNVNAGITPFKLSFTDFGAFPLLEVMILLGVATIAAVVGLVRRTTWPVLWFVAAAVTTLFATIRLGELRYFAPGYVLAIPAALWLFRRRSSPAASPLVWALVAVVVVPTFLHMHDAANAASAQERQANAATQLADRLLGKNDVALVSYYTYPLPDTRWWGLVEDFVDSAPKYPYRFLPDDPRALQTAANQGLHVTYYIGPVAYPVMQKQSLTLGTGTYEVEPVPGGRAFANLRIVAVKLLSGPGT